MGVAEPCLGRLGDDMGDPPWRTLAEAAPPVPGPAPLDATPADTYTYPVDTPPTGEDPARRLRAATEAAADWYHQQLLYSRDPQAAEARHYLQGRGVGPDDWKQWRLGWAPDRWRNVTNHLKDDQAALDAGIAAHSKTGRVYDTMRGRVIMPICDTEGDVVAFAGRALHEGDDTPKYLNTRTTSLWSKSSTLYGLHQAAPSIAETGSASLVEGYLDVIAAHRSGLTNAVASCGTAVTQAHIDALEDVGADQVYLALDGDDAGRAAARAARRITRDSGLPTRTVNLPQGEDPASLDPAELHCLWNAAEPQPWAEISTQLHDHDPHNETVERLVPSLTGHTGRNQRLRPAHPTSRRPPGRSRMRVPVPSRARRQRPPTTAAAVDRQQRRPGAGRGSHLRPGPRRRHNRHRRHRHHHRHTPRRTHRLPRTPATAGPHPMTRPNPTSDDPAAKDPHMATPTARPKARQSMHERIMADPEARAMYFCPNDGFPQNQSTPPRR